MQTKDIIKGLMSGQKSSSLQTKDSNNVWDIIPIKDFKNGILITENDYIAFMEVMPINLKLRSEREQKYITLKYEELLKIIRVPFYFNTIAKRADLKEHLDYVEKHIETEEVAAVREMAEEYKEFVKESARKNTVKKRFIIGIPYQHIKGVTATFNEAESWLQQTCTDYIDAIRNCGNEVILSDNNQFTAQILFELLNVRSSERERIPEL